MQCTEHMTRYRSRATLALLLFLLSGCGRVEPTRRATPAAPAATALAPAPSPTGGLSAAEAATLDSLEKVDGFPLYTMRYYADYVVPSPDTSSRKAGPGWGCSLFAALGDPQAMVYGRNFDWEYSPALLLFVDPPDGYASVSMVDIAYLGFAGSLAHTILDLPLSDRRGLLGAPYIPFDGLNDQGLAVGMAAVPPGDMQADPSRPTIGSLELIRYVLDHAANVDQALAIFRGYNVEMEGGVPIHYLLADRSGRSVLIEFYQGQSVVLANEAPWHLATNFIRASVGDSPLRQCARYDKIEELLRQEKGRLTTPGAFALLQTVSHVGTQWSIVYSLSTGDVTVAMGRKWGEVHAFRLDLAPRH